MAEIEVWLDGWEFGHTAPPNHDEYWTFETGSGKDAVWIEGYKVGADVRDSLGRDGIMSWQYQSEFIDTDTYYGDDNVDPY